MLSRCIGLHGGFVCRRMWFNSTTQPHAFFAASATALSSLGGFARLLPHQRTSSLRLLLSSTTLQPCWARLLVLRSAWLSWAASSDFSKGVSARSTHQRILSLRLQRFSTTLQRCWVRLSVSRSVWLSWAASSVCSDRMTVRHAGLA